MKRLVSGIMHFLELFLLICVALDIGLLGLPLLILSVIPVQKFYNDITGNNIKNSLFSVSKNGYIVQNSFGKPLRFWKLLGEKDKSKVFKDEILNVFLEMQKSDKNGMPIKYHIKSHIMVYQLLRRLERNGYIENLHREKIGESSLTIEKLSTGRFKEAFKKKKHPIYKITFNLTDKPRRREELLELLNSNNKEMLSSKNANITTTSPVADPVSDNNLSMPKEPSIEDLEKLKEELLACKEEIPQSEKQL